MAMDPYSLREIFEVMTLALIASLRRTLWRHLKEQKKAGFEWEQWQLTMLRGLERYRRANRAIVGQYSREVEKVIAEVLGDSFRKGKSRVDAVLAAVDKDVKVPGPRFFGINEKKLQALQRSVTDDMEEAQHAVLRKMDDVYRQTVFKAQVHMDAGAATLDRAVDMATKDFLDQGIRCIEYNDGRRVNVASYAEMVLRTASQRAAFLGEGQKRNEWGIYTIFVSAHATACDLCLPWQSKVLIDDVYSGGQDTGEHPLLSEAMTAGLLHPNCRHTLATYFPGVTKLPEPVDEETARKQYEAEQKQRYLERQVRRWKRHAAGSLDAENREKAAEKVKEWQAELRKHLKENPQLRRDYRRERLLDGGEGRPVIDTKSLEGLTTADGIAIAPSEHFLDSAHQRNIEIESIRNALQHPLRIGKIKVDTKGRPSKTYIGRHATVAINPEAGVLVTVYRTSKSRVKKIEGERGED